MASKSFQSQQHVFRYKSFVIDKDQLLGHGSYGAVYKAMCDQLPCAAKILHQSILDPKDKGSEKIMQRFVQECTFLENIRHPHIVQYLSMTTEPESRLPVLLMELLDESLTTMLECSQQSLAYYVQVDICHDIALAVAYLHSNDIIHRDLSSNNVLMIAGRRAKVTDFGMSKLAGTTSTKSQLTMCPGTVAYMSPEALREPPRYTKKLDCFSEGVIMIQVCTKLLPDPGPRSQLVQDTRSPTGSIEIPALETERRKSHIDLINPTHPLLPVAIDCLGYQDNERPSSEEICQSVSDLKALSNYQESLQHADQLQDEAGSSNQERKLKVKEKINMQTIQQQQEEIRAKNVQLQEKDKLFQKKESQFQRELASRERRIQQINHQLEEQQKTTAGLQKSNHSLKQQVKQLEDLLSQQKRQGVRSSQPLSPPVRHPAQIRKQQQGGEEHVYCSLIKSEPEQVPPPPQPRHKPRPPSEHYECVQGAAEQVPPPPQPRRKPHPPSDHYECVQGATAPLPPQRQSRPAEPRHKPPPPPPNEKIALEWRDGGKAPFIMERGGAVSNGNIVYFMSIRGESCSYNVLTQKWNELPKCPYGYSSLAIIHGHLTAIGGCTFDKFEPQNKLVSRMGDRGWVEYFPPMPTKRWKSAAVSMEQYLVVAGGKKETTAQLNTVEVMDIQNMEWSTVASLPHPYSEASAAICGDVIYMLGGFDDNGKTKSVLTCSLTELLQRRKRSTVWNRVADVPTTRSTCATVSGHLLAVGGLDAQNRKASTIYEYSTSIGSWDLISNMPTAQYNRLVSVLPTQNVMIVVGGCTRFKTDTVDIAKANTIM